MRWLISVIQYDNFCGHILKTGEKVGRGSSSRDTHRCQRGGKEAFVSC